MIDEVVEMIFLRQLFVCCIYTRKSEFSFEMVRGEVP